MTEPTHPDDIAGCYEVVETDHIHDEEIPVVSVKERLARMTPEELAEVTGKFDEFCTFLIGLMCTGDTNALVLGIQMVATVEGWKHKIEKIASRR